MYADSNRTGIRRK